MPLVLILKHSSVFAVSGSITSESDISINWGISLVSDIHSHDEQRTDLTIDNLTISSVCGVGGLFNKTSSHQTP